MIARIPATVALKIAKHYETEVIESDEAITYEENFRTIMDINRTPIGSQHFNLKLIKQRIGGKCKGKCKGRHNYFIKVEPADTRQVTRQQEMLAGQSFVAPHCTSCFCIRWMPS